LKWRIRIVAGIGLLLAVGILLFPRWYWTSPGSDCHGCNAQYSFVSHPPAQDASLDVKEMQFWSCAVVTLTFVAVLLLKQRGRDQQAQVYWRIQWDYATNNPDTLLRASDETGAQSEVLLRAAKTQETPKEEWLRVAEE
jgi:hypothetical protein